MTDSYDVIVIGAGATGEHLAGRTARAGLSTAVIEHQLVGGECSYWACVPSKALLRPPEAVAAARRVAGAKEAVSGSLDVAAVLRRRDSFTSRWDDEGQAKWVESLPAELIRGRAKLAGERRVAVELADGGRRELEARHAVAICTGSLPALPPIPGLAEARPWTPREGTSAEESPGRLAIIGGGVAGCELATIWSALGSEVTVLEVKKRLLDRFEPFASELVAESLRGRGVDVRSGVEVAQVERAPGGGPVRISAGGDKVEADEVLAATGRRPVTDDLGLDAVGVKDGGWLTVDESGHVEGVDGWLYAAGDVTGKALLTHTGKYQARVAGDSILARARDRVPERPVAWSRFAATALEGAVPQTVFTDPQVAAVGMTDADARALGRRVRSVDYDLGSVSGSNLFADGYTGKARLVVDEARRVLLGATFVGPEVAELLHAATIAVVGEVPLERLWHAIPSFPTISEVWLWMLIELGL